VYSPHILSTIDNYLVVI